MKSSSFTVEAPLGAVILMVTVADAAVQLVEQVAFVVVSV
jgi:hypothetical protein